MDNAKVIALVLGAIFFAGAIFNVAETASGAERPVPVVHESRGAPGAAVAGMPPIIKPHGPHTASPGVAETGRNLLANADFTRGAGNSPDDWRTGGWKESPDVTTYDWLHSPGSEPELIINNVQPNDARWIQSLSLGPGWYYISVQARTENVGANAAGATISLDEGNINSFDLRGTTQWQRIGFYLKIGRRGADVDVALRLGNFGSLTTGRAFFRTPELVKISAPPSRAGPQFDLTAIRKAMMPKPVGHLWTLIATAVLLVILTGLGWTLYGTGELAQDPVLAPPPAAERRRRGDDARRRGKQH